MAEGESVVVISGAGGVGNIAVQLGKSMGAGRVIATASTEEKRRLCLELGADAAVDPETDDLTAALIEANEGERVDVVFEMAGGRIFDQAFEALAPFGRIVAYGIASREPEHGRDRPPDAQEPLGDRLLAHALPRPPGDDGGAARRTSSSAWPAASCGRRWAAPTRCPRCARPTRTSRAAAPPENCCSIRPRKVEAVTFAELGLSKPMLDALSHLGYERPTPIQEQTIPALLEGRDVIGQAQTGTGKTAAFGLPMLEYIDPEQAEVQAIVLTPTRELCIQVTQALRAYGQKRGIDVVAVFGGASIRDQASRLNRGAQVVVGTVGRVLDMISRHHLMLDQARYVVLDEADEMLDLGFLEDVETILSRCPSGRQTALFSAPRSRGRSRSWPRSSCTTR